ncbi:MAG: flagellar motor switch protein FliG [Glaciihabitans sp.]|nr:flagellar motor switch protein FliG [Glaciihabitans sp.]
MINPKTGLTGMQKAAVVLMSMDHEHAALVLKQFTEAEAEEIATAIIGMRSVDDTLTDTALSEFHDSVTRGRSSARGGSEFAAGLLESSFGAEKAAGVMKRVSRSMAGKAFEFLQTVEQHQIISLLDGEMAQTSALVVAHLNPALASGVLAGMSDEKRIQVAQRIATMTSATPEAISLLSANLKLRAAAVVSPRNALEVVGGIQPLVDIINRANAATERAILEGLDARDPKLAEEVRAKLVTFADIVRLDARDLQLVLRGVEIPTLALALKGASEPVQQAIISNVSERNRELLADETGVLGAVRKSQIDDARAEVVRSIRELEAAGTLTLQREGGDDVLV